ncbi:MAG: hypothetical protein M1120_02405 [Patescibacteria group bacterium]|nr:hypothetical protein [Patescibacteria group bacterium]
MWNIKKHIISFLSILIVLFGKPVPVYGQRVPTALGNIPADPAGLAGWVLTSSIEVAGGIAFLLMAYGGFLFLTSAGDPNKLQEATDVIMSAIAGLLMIIFSVFLLRLIGYDILKIF